MSLNWKKVQRRLKLQFISLILLLILQLVFAIVTSAAPNSRQTPTTKAQTETTPAPEQATSTTIDELTAWEILWMCDWFTWPFIVITVIGVALLVYRALAEYQQKTRSQGLLVQPIDVANLSQFVKHLNVSQSSRASQLFTQLIATFNKTKHAEPLHEDINNYLQGQKDTFETFNRVMGFLSDTAGALGLLGTVWGIFVTFYSGKMDGPTILKGMSIALITTLVGLVISLIFNTGSTTIFTFFNRQLKLLNERAEELRQAMLHLQTKGAPSTTERTSQRAEPVRKPRPMEKLRQEREPEPLVIGDDEIEVWS